MVNKISLVFSNSLVWFIKTMAATNNYFHDRLIWRLLYLFSLCIISKSLVLFEQQCLIHNDIKQGKAKLSSHFKILHWSKAMTCCRTSDLFTVSCLTLKRKTSSNPSNVDNYGWFSSHIYKTTPKQTGISLSHMNACLCISKYTQTHTFIWEWATWLDVRFKVR